MSAGGVVATAGSGAAGWVAVGWVALGWVALGCVAAFMTGEFQGGRHARRVDKITALEESETRF